MINYSKAKILEYMANTDGPVTFPMMTQMLDIGDRSLAYNLERMDLEKVIEKKSFRKSDMNPYDYLGISQKKTKAPKFFYIITEKGLRKYEYYKSQGIYEKKKSPREMHLERQMDIANMDNEEDLELI